MIRARRPWQCQVCPCMKTSARQQIRHGARQRFQGDGKPMLVPISKTATQNILTTIQTAGFEKVCMDFHVFRFSRRKYFFEPLQTKI